MIPSDNRTWTRLSPEDNAVQLKCAGAVTLAEVYDVSFGGVSLLIDRQLEVLPGDTVDVCWRGTWMRGVVRHLGQWEGEVRLGIEWAKSKAGAK